MHSVGIPINAPRFSHSPPVSLLLPRPSALFDLTTAERIWGLMLMRSASGSLRSRPAAFIALDGLVRISKACSSWLIAARAAARLA